MCVEKYKKCLRSGFRDTTCYAHAMNTQKCANVGFIFFVGIDDFNGSAYLSNIEVKEDSA